MTSWGGREKLGGRIKNPEKGIRDGDKKKKEKHEEQEQVPTSGEVRQMLKQRLVCNVQRFRDNATTCSKAGKIREDERRGGGRRRQNAYETSIRNNTNEEEVYEAWIWLRT